ncbi:HNH endonuclease [Halomonas sp. S2151]|uniref:HNH endonuclease n=1 Tax=Halomonas sp. S2151 TaxID=579478 RepID=UPI0012EDC6C5|nr:HNH endonuclease [Halomonas sp. S2151]
MVKELLHYDPDTGIFTWKSRDRRWFSSNVGWGVWNGRFAGKRAGCERGNSANGYRRRRISILNSYYLEHRLAWLWMEGGPVPEQIDHVNRDATDNRWANLREAKHIQNGRNQSLHSNNSSGYGGVSRSSGKWRARCHMLGKDHHIGTFDDVEKAAEAVQEFRRLHGFSPEHGLTPPRYHTHYPEPIFPISGRQARKR